MIKISEKAAIRLNELKISQNHNTDFNLRVLVKGGGCSGLMYELKFDNEISDTDKIFEDAGIKIIIDKKNRLNIRCKRSRRGVLISVSIKNNL